MQYPNLSTDQQAYSIRDIAHGAGHCGVVFSIGSWLRHLQFEQSLQIQAACPFKLAQHPRIRRCLSLLCLLSLTWVVFATRWCEARACSVLDMFVRRALSSYTLDNTLFNGLSDQQQVGDDGHRYLLRATKFWFRGLSIGIESNDRTGAAATVAYCASDRIVKVTIDSYHGHQKSLKVILNRPSYNNTFASPSIDTNC